MSPRRPHPGQLRRERRALLDARESRLRDLGGLLVEMYRRGGFRNDVLAEACAAVVGIDVRLAEIDEILTTGGRLARCTCGAGLPSGSNFCPNCGRRTSADDGTALGDQTIVSPPPG